MVFWITLQQMKLFDIFRPANIEFLKIISNHHSHEEEYSSVKVFDKIVEHILDRMRRKTFGFTAVSACNISVGRIHVESKAENGVTLPKEVSAVGGKGFYVKLYKLSNVLQYLSVIEITVEKMVCANGRETYTQESERLLGQQQRHLTDGGEVAVDADLCVISIKSFSTSFFPAFFPLGFLLGYLFILIPFSDHGANKRYVKELASSLNLSSICTESHSSTEVTSSDDSDNSVLPPSSIFFFCFILTPVLLAACFLLLF